MQKGDGATGSRVAELRRQVLRCRLMLAIVAALLAISVCYVCARLLLIRMDAAARTSLLLLNAGQACELRFREMSWAVPGPFCPGYLMRTLIRSDAARNRLLKDDGVMISPDGILDGFGNPISMRRSGKGVIIYSYGLNGEDDQGANDDASVEVSFPRSASERGERGAPSTEAVQ